MDEIQFIIKSNLFNEIIYENIDDKIEESNNINYDIFELYSDSE